MGKRIKKPVVFDSDGKIVLPWVYVIKVVDSNTIETTGIKKEE